MCIIRNLGLHFYMYKYKVFFFAFVVYESVFIVAIAL